MRSAVINKAINVKLEKWDWSRISYIAGSFDRNLSDEKIVPNGENLLNTEAQDAKVKVSTLQTIMIWISLKGFLVAWVNADFYTFQSTLQLTSSGCMKGPYTGLGAVQPRQPTEIISRKRLRFRITKQKVKRQDFGSGNYNTLFNLLMPNVDYSSRTAPLTSKCCILYIYSTNICTENFKHGIYSPFFPLQNAVCFIILTYLVPVLFTFYIQGALKLKK